MKGGQLFHKQAGQLIEIKIGHLFQKRAGQLLETGGGQ